jgi:hypothetical protein
MIAFRVPALHVRSRRLDTFVAAAVPAPPVWKDAEILLLRHQLSVLQQ